MRASDIRGPLNPPPPPTEAARTASQLLAARGESSPWRAAIRCSPRRPENRRCNASDRRRRCIVAHPAVGGGRGRDAVFLDPGHNGVSDASINQQVPNGRGGTKACQTTGAAADDGYPEHTFTWAVVADRMR